MRVNPLVAAVAVGCLLILGLLPGLHFFFAHGPDNPVGNGHCSVCLLLSLALLAVLGALALPLPGDFEPFRGPHGQLAWASDPVQTVSARAPPYSS